MDEEEQRKWKHTYKKMEAFLSTLPREKGWLSEHLFQFQGFWYHKRTLQGTIVAQQHLKARSSDIFLVTYPKSGTPWIKAIAFAIMNRTHYNHQTRPSIPACFFLHFATKVRAKDLPPLFQEEMLEQFARGVSPYGSYWDQVLGYWKASLEWPHRVLFLKYDEMKSEPAVHVKRLAEFMGQPLSLEEERDGAVHALVELCSFEGLSNLEVKKTGKRQAGQSLEQKILQLPILV
ncbi:flavonol 4'-sulfotransferase-like [Vitis riparia]|uniref:flavonol 4'-sulfotransferase-like n=1 Tax=Vitis riparia TaxID=96939 RepID=UPI00155A5F31|nr:flavonol 4'-sulfotransferase-like [Vitis riparia]